MEDNYTVVRFDIYCNKCKYKDRDERLNPCNECLEVGARENTHVPEYWEGAENQR